MKNRQKFAVIGAGGLGKEVLCLAQECGWHLADFIGFIDQGDHSGEVTCLGRSFPVFEEQAFSETFPPSDEIALFPGIGSPRILAKVGRKFSAYQFPNLIHPSVSLHRESVQFGVGNIVTAGCVLTCDIRIGSLNILNIQTIVGHDVNIGSFNILNPATCVCGNVTLGDETFIGAGATILQNLSIGSGAVIGAASLVRKPVGPGEMVYGVPAQAARQKDGKG